MFRWVDTCGFVCLFSSWNALEFKAMASARMHRTLLLYFCMAWTIIQKQVAKISKVVWENKITFGLVVWINFGGEENRL